MWTDTTRAIHARKGLALPSNLTNGEWAVLEPYFPLPSKVRRPRKSMPPTFRTAMAPPMCSPGSATASHGCAMSSPMVAMPEIN